MVDQDRVRALRAEGWTYQQIADDQDCTPERVRQIVKDVQLTPEQVTRHGQKQRQRRVFASVLLARTEGRKPTVGQLERLKREMELDAAFASRVREQCSDCL